MSILPVVVSDFISFIKVTSYKESKTPFWKLYLLDPLSTFLILIIIIIPFNSLSGILENSENSLEELVRSAPAWELIIYGAMVTPLIEEIIFRSWLHERIVQKKYLKLVYIVSSLIFGLAHLRNYEEIGFSTIILVLPQIAAGFVLGYIRIVKGMRYSWLAHGLTNGLLLISSLGL